MRTLTLNEKITIKGGLARKSGFNCLPKLTMEQALYYWYVCYGRSVAEYWRVS